ncbi:DEAD/DEAH box helicase [Bryobacterales bacterium F-183]|nr:DEAD/DEAH box helicase [Bryobacterales bacterium F-183]
MIQHFSDLKLCSALRDNLARNQFVTPTPVQAQAIPPLLEGRDVVATAQTGTGKTLAFSIPLIEALAAVPRTKTIKALILSPTRELAIQIDEAFRQLAHGMQIRTAVVVGGMSEKAQLRDIQAGAEVVIATPGRLCDYLDRRIIDLSRTATVVLDEADRMLDMGFLPDLRLIMGKLPTKRHTMLFSATMDSSVAGLVASYVNNPERIAVEACAETAGRIDLFCYQVPRGSKYDLLEYLLKNEQGSFLVFVATKEGADRLTKFLERENFKVAAIHGDRSQNERNKALQGFKDGLYRVLVATDVAARGIHVDDIAHVVNYDLPQEPENFVHRIGRTGRAGSRGASWTFVTPLELSDVRKYERTLGIQVQFRELPPLPRPIGLISEADMEEFLASMSAASLPPLVKDPKPTPPTPSRSFSTRRRRR